MAYFFRLDHRARLLAVFSPKCASTTLRDWLQALDRHGETRDARQPIQQSVLQGIQAPIQQPAQQLTPTFFEKPQPVTGYRDYFKVLFLRDPLRRLVSFYAHWVVRHPGVWSFADHDRRFSLDQKSFRRFLYVLDHLHRNGLRFQHHLEPQMARTEGIEFDRVVLVEQLRPGLQELNRLLGLDYLPPHATRTHYDLRTPEPAADHPPHWFRAHTVPETRWFFDEELLELGERICATDVACYRLHGGKTATASE